MEGDSGLRAILKLLQLAGLAPYSIGRDRKSSKRSITLCAYNLIFASFVMYNMIWAENDSRNNVDFPNKSFLISIAFDTVDVLENIHLCVVTFRSLIFTSAGLEVWFKIKYINQKLKDLNVEFDDKKFKRFIYLKAAGFILTSLLFLGGDIILCSRLNMYYTANYWVLCGIPLIHNAITGVSFSGFTLILYQRFWAINEFLNAAIDRNKELWSEQMDRLKSSSIDISLINVTVTEKSLHKYCPIRMTNLKKNRIRPSAISVKKKPPVLIMLKNNECFSRNFHVGMIRSLKVLYFDLFEVSRDVNSIFGWSLLFLFTISFFGCTINMYFVIIFHLRSYESEQYVSCLLWAMIYLIKVIYLIVFSIKTSKEAGRTTDLLHILLSQTDLNDTQLQAELKTFCLQNIQCKIKFKAADFFNVDQSILFQFIAGVLSNVVFVVQFDKINFSKR